MGFPRSFVLLTCLVSGYLAMPEMLLDASSMKREALPPVIVEPEPSTLIQSDDSKLRREVERSAGYEAGYEAGQPNNNPACNPPGPTPGPCPTIEVSVMIDATVWDFYKKLFPNLSDTQIEEKIKNHYRRVYAECNLRLSHWMKYRDFLYDKKDAPCTVNCLRVFPKIFIIQKNIHYDWSTPYQQGNHYYIYDTNQCNNARPAGVDVAHCWTRYDIIVKEPDNLYYNYHKTAGWKDVCTTQWTAHMMEAQGDAEDLALCHAVLHSFSANNDPVCGYTDYQGGFIMQPYMSVPPQNPIMWYNSWEFSSCTTVSVCNAVEKLGLGSCIYTQDHSESDFLTFFALSEQPVDYTRDQLCKLRWGLSSGYCGPEPYPDHVCELGLPCINPENGQCTCRVRVLSQTPCGDNKICFKGKCIWKDLGKLGGRCDCEDDCCSPNSECKLGVCSCRPGFYPFNNLCIAKILTGEPCSPDDQCLDANAACLPLPGTNDKRCVCRNGFYPVERRCMPQSCLGENCTGTIACKGAEGTVMCNNDSICECAPYHHANDLGQCVRNVGLGGSCTDNEECSAAVPLVLCKDGICQCPEKYRANAGNTRCEELSCLGESCNNKNDCIVIAGQVICNSDGVCACADDYHANDVGACVINVGLGQQCTTDEQCSATVDLALCVNGTCQCPANYRPNGGQCQPLDCNATNCPEVHGDPPLEFIEGVCRCPEPYSLIILPDIEYKGCQKGDYGDYCNDEPDTCTELNTKCNTTGENRCRCAPGTLWDGQLCLVPLGHECSDDVNNCEDPNAVCDPGSPESSCPSRCACADGFYNPCGCKTCGGSCVARLPKGSRCESSGDCDDPCAEGSLCTNDYCIGDVPLEETCVDNTDCAEWPWAICSTPEEEGPSSTSPKKCVCNEASGYTEIMNMCICISM